MFSCIPTKSMIKSCMRIMHTAHWCIPMKQHSMFPPGVKREQAPADKIIGKFWKKVNGNLLHAIFIKVKNRMESVTTSPGKSFTWRPSRWQANLCCSCYSATQPVLSRMQPTTTTRNATNNKVVRNQQARCNSWVEKYPTSCPCVLCFAKPCAKSEANARLLQGLQGWQ